MVSNNTLRSDIYSAFYTALNGNIAGVSLTTSAYPDEKPVFPMVVINSPNVAKESLTYDRSYSSKNIVVVIDLYTLQAIQLDTLGDAIDVIVSSLKIPGMSLLSSDESIAISPSNDSKIRLKSFSYSYKRG